MPTYTQEVAEAICGGLHFNEFRFLGETPPTGLDSGPTTWWTRGTKPDVVQVAVIRSDPIVRVNIAYPNLAAPPRVIKGEIVMTVRCERSRKTEVEKASGNIVRRCLEVYLDVLGGTGVAGIDALPQRPLGPIQI